MTREEIAEVLKKTRNNAGLTQQQAAQAIGRKQQTLASWETGQSQPDANTLFQLFDVYGASVDEAFGFNKKTPDPVDTESGESKEIDYIYQELVDFLSKSGYLRNGEDLSEEDFRFLSALIDFLDSYFDTDAQRGKD